MSRIDATHLAVRVLPDAAHRRRKSTPRLAFHALIALIGLAGWFPAASVHAAACTPDTGYSNCESFTYSGANQTFTLPANAIPGNVLVKAWGAGGGGVDYYIMNGGGGGYAQGVLNLTANRTLTVIVGGGGQSACYSNREVTGSLNPTYGGGGASNTNPNTSATVPYFCGASGGGRSAVRVGAGVANTSTQSEVIAAGGGGGTSDGTAELSQQAGEGSGGNGTNGRCGLISGTNSAAACTAGAGRGATTTAGGAAGPVTVSAPPTNSPAAGVSFQGGVSGCGRNPNGPIEECGGGGGGGYLGGGGAAFNGPVYDSPGGGGSGHLDPVVTSTATATATNFTPPRITEAQYVAGVGVGGGTGSLTVSRDAGSDTNKPGGNGLVVIQYNLLPTVTIRKISNGGVGAFDFSGSNGIANQTITTVTAGTAVSGTTQTLTAANTQTTITEAVPVGYTLTSATCTGLGTGGTATLAGGTLTLNAAATAAASTIVCTFTNTLVNADLSITKTNTPAQGANDQAGDTVIRGVATTYNIVVSNGGPSAVTNAVLRDPAPTSMSGCVLGTPACAVTTGTATCPAVGTAAGQLSVGNLQNAAGTGVLIPSMAVGSSITVKLTCTVN